MKFVTTDTADLGMTIHTAFRKGLDDDLSCVIYQLINGIDEEWCTFINWLQEKISKKKISIKSPHRMAIDFHKQLLVWISGPQVWSKKPLLRALVYAIKMMPHDDVETMFEYCFEE